MVEKKTQKLKQVFTLLADLPNNVRHHNNKKSNTNPHLKPQHRRTALANAERDSREEEYSASLIKTASSCTL